MSKSQTLRTLILSSFAVLLLVPTPALAQRSMTNGKIEGPIATALENLGDDVRIFEEHVVTLSNPFMEGRVPGSRGMEIAKEYFEHWLKEAGMEPAFPVKAEDGTVTPFASYRQAFPLGGRRKIMSQSLSAEGLKLMEGKDYACLPAGGSGDVTADMVFVGYAIARGPDDWSSFPEDVELEGKIAVAFRWEPMDAHGKSLWSTERRPWSRRHRESTKIRACAERKAAGLIIINTPGANDPRNEQMTVTPGGRRRVEMPVFRLSQAAGERLLQAAGADASLKSLREKADKGGVCVPLGQSKVSLAAKVEREQLMAENVAGYLPGKGKLKDEIVVVGAHLDHLGMGSFGSRSRKDAGKKLHPGADDNASGSAAILMLADKLKKAYDALPEDKPARSMIFMGFSAEESGLNGSRFYADNPIIPIEKHALMINFDMIGRITNKRLSVSGIGTAKGMKEWLEPLFTDCGLEIVQRSGGGGGSDHAMFVRKQVPVLFSIIADFHPDYHTPEDVSWKINREDAVRTVHLYEKIAFTAGTLDQPFEFQRSGRRVQR